MTDQTPPHGSQILAEAGRELYGETWTCELGRALDLNSRTLRRIRTAALAGEPYWIAPGVMVELAALLRTRARALEAMAQRVEGAGLADGAPRRPRAS